MVARLRAQPRARASPSGSSTGCAAALLRRPSRGEHGGAPSRPAARHRCPTGPVEQYQARSGKVGTPARARRRPRRRADAGDRGADAARSTPSSTRPRPSRSASPAATRASSTGRSCRRCWPPAPGATCSRYRTLKVLADLDPAVAEVTGYTRYAHRRPTTDLDRRPWRHLPRSAESRVDRNTRLRGTKHRVAIRTRGARGDAVAATAAR